MIILCVLAGYAVLGGVIFFTGTALTRAKAQLLAARQQAVRAGARQAAARKAAGQAERQCRQLLASIETSIAHTGQALEVAGQIEAVGQQLGSLIAFVASPELETAPPRHALPAGGRRALPAHAHAAHPPYSQVSVSNGDIRYITD